MFYMKYYIIIIYFILLWTIVLSILCIHINNSETIYSNFDLNTPNVQKKSPTKLFTAKKVGYHLKKIKFVSISRGHSLNGWKNKVLVKKSPYSPIVSTKYL